MTTRAEVICDSVSPQGKRLTTLKLRYPKYVHSELMTHRVLSRNASSSRAVPVKWLLHEARDDVLRAEPCTWDRNRPGMQGAEPLEGMALEQCRTAWKNAALAAAAHAELMDRHGAHKQNVNRVLEPFTHINVVVTATEWDNFFGLRLDKAAQPDMRALAVAMWEARKATTPQQLEPGEWHLPFVDHGVDYDAVHMKYGIDGKTAIPNVSADDHLLIRISVARVARVSYESFVTGKRSTVEEDLKLHDMLLSSKHLSPFEHQATPDVWVTEDQAIKAYGDGDEPCPLIGWQKPNEHGNFVGWRQNRKMIEGEAVAPLPETYR